MGILVQPCCCSSGTGVFEFTCVSLGANIEYSPAQIRGCCSGELAQIQEDLRAKYTWNSDLRANFIHPTVANFGLLGEHHFNVGNISPPFNEDRIEDGEWAYSGCSIYATRGGLFGGLSASWIDETFSCPWLMVWSYGLSKTTPPMYFLSGVMQSWIFFPEPVPEGESGFRSSIYYREFSSPIQFNTEAEVGNPPALDKYNVYKIPLHKTWGGSVKMDCDFNAPHIFLTPFIGQFKHCAYCNPDSNNKDTTPYIINIKIRDVVPIFPLPPSVRASYCLGPSTDGCGCSTPEQCLNWNNDFLCVMGSQAGCTYEFSFSSVPFTPNELCVGNLVSTNVVFYPLILCIGSSVWFVLNILLNPAFGLSPDEDIYAVFWKNLGVNCEESFDCTSVINGIELSFAGYFRSHRQGNFPETAPTQITDEVFDCDIRNATITIEVIN